jgi:hypothetical protein
MSDGVKVPNDSNPCADPPVAKLILQLLKSVFGFWGKLTMRVLGIVALSAALRAALPTQRTSHRPTCRLWLISNIPALS